MKIKSLFASIFAPLVLLAARYAWADAPFTVSVDGTEVTDGRTSLIWRRCAEGMAATGGSCTGTASTFTRELAFTRARDQASSTGVAWRLPNVKELASIADRSKSNPAINTVAFPATPFDNFWSSSPYVGEASYAWVVNSSGRVNKYLRGDTWPVRLVRAGQ